MEDPDPKRADDAEKTAAEAEAQAAVVRKARAQNALGAREFVSDRDALEDAWAGSRERSARDEGW